MNTMEKSVYVRESQIQVVWQLFSAC